MTSETEVPLSADEETTLAAALSAQRAAVVAVLDGLSDEEVSREVGPAGWSLLGIVQRLGHVETYWSRKVFLGEAVDPPSDDDPRGWYLDPGASRQDVLSFYREAAAKTDEIIAACEFGSQAALPRRRRSLRWIVVHLIGETARHAGRADLARALLEAADGPGA